MGNLFFKYYLCVFSCLTFSQTVSEPQSLVSQLLTQRNFSRAEIELFTQSDGMLLKW